MASFVTEVLASSGKLEKEDLSGKISKMSRKVEETKEEVCDMINKRYGEFLPTLQSSEDLMVQVDTVSKEMDTLKNWIETEVLQNVHVAVAEYTKLKQQLEKNTIIITMLEHLKEFHNAMEEFNKALPEKKYVDAANQLERAKKSVDSLKSEKISDLPLFSVLSSELTVQRENLLFHLGDEWKQLVIWKLPSSKGKTSHSEKVCESILNNVWKLQSASVKSILLAQLFSALQCFRVEILHMFESRCFSGQVLLKNMLKPLVMHASLEVRLMEKQGEGTTMALQCSEQSHEERSAPAVVYRKLLLVLKTLHSALLGKDGPENTAASWRITAQYGSFFFFPQFFYNCFVFNPTYVFLLSPQVIKETEEFEKSLKEMEYLQRDSTDLLKYARDVNCHFASKKCKDVIVAARKLMTSKMHNTVKITPDSELLLLKLPALGSQAAVKRESGEDAAPMANPKQLSPMSMRLPACRISESVEQLMELALDTLREAIGSSTQCALQLFFTVRNIFQLFCDVVPTYHKENLLKFPHLAAIQHNNCMYLAHQLLTLGHHFRPHLPQPLNESFATFVDMVPGFRKLGAQCFLTQLKVQSAELLERLSTAHNFCNLDDEDNYIAASKAVRQVIHQLKQLGTVWQDVLPVSIYCKAMGSLLNTAVTEIIAKIMMLEDISSEDGEHLHTLCQSVIEEGPLVFIPLAEENRNRKYQEEVPLHVRKWGTFRELVLVLRANLQEIVDRWADGKGPLAMEFSSLEVKSLIRALFQNTERRAVALSKIK
uniref:Centromere/kinetochore protein zw10 homolog n=1 Tax=Salarias fasciatus TaxID=181472 RepID=A0A672HL02_SALFA